MTIFRRLSLSHLSARSIFTSTCEMPRHTPRASRASSSPKAQHLKTEECQEAIVDARQDELEQFHDHADQKMISREELERYLEEEEQEQEEEQDDECHFLIGADKENSASPKKPNQVITQVQMRKNNQDSPRSVFARLGGYLASASTRPQHQDANSFDNFSTSDFVYQATDWNSSEREQMAAPKWRHLNRAYQSNDDLRQASSTLDFARDNFNSRSHQTPKSLSANNNPLKPYMFICLFLMLASCATLLLIRLMSLVEDERTRLGIDSSPGVTRANSSRQKLILELSSQLDEAHRKQLEIEQLSKWLVSSPKCHIPVLDPWHASISEFVRRKEPMNCSRLIEEERAEEAKSAEHKNRFQLATSTMSYALSNRLLFTDRAIQLGALSTPHAPGQCCLRRVSREVENDDELVYSKCEPIYQQGLFVNSSIVEVNCLAWNYTNVHSFVVHNQEEEAGLVRVGAQKLNNDGDHYNVLMLGVDTISRLNGQRQLSGTLQVLQDLYQTLEFVGYNKVGENTFPNLIPLLTGLKPGQLIQVQCWQAKNYTEESDRGDDYLDNCKYLWSYYQQVGYRTYFSEDWPEASTFNYLKPGFKYEPTTFYGRPYTLARKSLRFPRFDSIGCASCQLDQPIVGVDLNNLKTFIENNTNQLPYFAFHWINCPQHDDLNGASQIDHLISRFFKDLHERLQLDRTFVIFFSDHGYRWNDFVSTRIGHYESSLPMMTIAPPKDFLKKHPELYANMRKHQSALLTPFDIFKTLIDLKELGSRPGTGSSKAAKAANKTRRAKKQTFFTSTTELDSSQTVTLEETSGAGENAPLQASSSAYPSRTTSVKQLKFVDGTTFKQKFKILSLFDAHSQQELDRSCMEAGIPDNYCVCHQFEPLDVRQLDVLGAAYYLVYIHFEVRLRNHSNICRRLDLERIHHAEMFDLERAASTKKNTLSRRRKRSNEVTVLESSSEENQDDKRELKTSAKPANRRVQEDAGDENDEKDEKDEPSGGDSNRLESNKHDSLPNREYSLMLSTKPGSGLFQEVVRFYGDSLEKCREAVSLAKKVIEDEYANPEDKRDSVRLMNEDCEFSVHSESLSRFNLYRDQSKCVKSNIELKKLCYCNDLD